MTQGLLQWINPPVVPTGMRSARLRALALARRGAVWRGSVAAL
ncbi:hypothetical protein [Sphingomonas sp.]|nr:hypothetical protein [Sphingomonas sp.]